MPHKNNYDTQLALIKGENINVGTKSELKDFFVLLIGVIAAIATPLIKNIMDNVGRSSCCQSLGYVWKENKCYKTDMSGTVTIVSKDGTCSETAGA